MEDEKHLDELLDEVEAVFRRTRDKFKFTVESFQYALTARDVHEQISGKRLTIAEFYDFIGDRQAIEVGGDYITENWRKVIPLLFPMLQKEGLSQLVQVILDDPLIYSVATIEGHKIGEKPIIIRAQTYMGNADAYFLLADVYEHLANTYNMNLICVEGAEGYIDTTLIAAFPDPKIKRDTGEYLVKQGKMSGPELFSVITETRPIIQGIEDSDLYVQLAKFVRGDAIDRDIFEVAQQRGKALLKNLQSYIQRHNPIVMAVESQSVGLYGIPDLSENTPHTVIEIQPRVRRGINWTLYNKVMKGSKTEMDDVFIRNVS